jgi:hypothetical protein
MSKEMLGPAVACLLIAGTAWAQPALPPAQPPAAAPAPGTPVADVKPPSWTEQQEAREAIPVHAGDVLCGEPEPAVCPKCFQLWASPEYLLWWLRKHRWRPRC